MRVGSQISASHTKTKHSISIEASNRGRWGGAQNLYLLTKTKKSSPLIHIHCFCTLFAPAKTEEMMAHVHKALTLTPASDMNSLDQVSSGEPLQNDITLVKVTIPIT
jgi:hypothetical protein